MSGGPVRRLDDDVVVGVVSGRYNSGDQWLRDTVWLARVEDLLPLLDGVAPVTVVEAPLGDTVDLVLTVSQTDVRLQGAGPEVAAPHRGVGEGLRGALRDVWLARARVSGQRADSVLERLEPAQVSLRRAGQLLADSFLPAPLTPPPHTPPTAAAPSTRSDKSSLGTASPPTGLTTPATCHPMCWTRSACTSKCSSRRPPRRSDSMAISIT
jgi:hypothetical protein